MDVARAYLLTSECGHKSRCIGTPAPPARPAARPSRWSAQELERKHGVTPLLKFVLYTDQAAMWRVQAVTQEGTAFTNRLGLLEAWRGLRDAELSAPVR